MPTLFTADVLDAHPDWVVVDPLFVDLGGRTGFHGPIGTVRVFEDNVLVKRTLSTPGEGRVLVVDGGGSRRCALVGGNVATLACENGWAGLVVFGCVRDWHELAAVDLGIKALGTHPRKSTKRGEGETSSPVRFAGVTFTPGDYLVADGDGIVVGPHVPRLG